MPGGSGILVMTGHVHSGHIRLKACADVWGRKGTTWVGAVLSLLGFVALSCPVTAAAQRSDRSSAADIMASLYFSNRPSLNGPLMQLRYLVRGPAASGLGFGLRVAFRDDEPGGGRVQALSTGVDVVLGMSEPFYLLGGLEGIANLTGGTDARTGLEGAVSVGFGAHAKGLPALVEARYTLGPGWRLWSIGLGLSNLDVGGTPRRAAAEVSSEDFGLTNARYQQTEGFRGYALTYERSLKSASTVALRGSVGIAFLDFNRDSYRWSTGAVTFLLGLPVTAAVCGRALAVQLVPEAGIWHFSEPREQVYPLLRVGPDVLVGTAAVGVTGGMRAVVAAGPAGTFRGVMWRLGARLAL
jgi:hypothetical protein